MKTFLSIGSGPGMGFATAARFAKEGFQVILTNRNPTKTQALADRLETKGRGAEVRIVDSGNPESVASLITGVVTQFGRIDVLHYNTASMRKATLAEQPRNTFSQDLAVNIGGALVATKLAVQSMSPRRSGTILLTGGGYSLAPNPQYISLSVGKAGIRALTFGMFEPLKREGIHIATVTIGMAIEPESREAEAVGDLFWQLHSQPIDQWTPEAKFPGS